MIGVTVLKKPHIGSKRKCSCLHSTSLYPQERTSLGPARAGRQALHVNGPRLFRVRPEDYYIVVNHYGRFGTAFAETDLRRADLETTIADLMSGQHCDPLRVVMFNPDTDRAEDVSHAMAQEILRRLGLEGRDVPSVLEDFIDRHVGKDRQLTLRLAS